MVRDFKLSRVPASFKYAVRGIWHVLRTEQNLQIHAVAAIAVVALAFYYRISAVEFAVILLAVGLVIASEVLNTVIEDFLDIIHPRHHESVRRIKDALAGAVLVAALVAVAVGCLVFGPYVLGGPG